MQIEIDNNAGFCFGVDDAIRIAEKEIVTNKELFCLGDIVHNDLEVERLKNKGLSTIDKQLLNSLKNKTVLIRAHGEPPQTFEIAKKNNLQLIDATCPIVRKLQERVKKAYQEGRAEEQIIIYGQIGHAEAVGLAGQIDNKAIIIESEYDLIKIDFNKPITIFSQTTKSNKNYMLIVEEIEKQIAKTENKYELRFNKTVCKQVAYRDEDLKQFAKKHQLIIFVSGKKSSNGKMLFEACKKINPKTYFISHYQEIEKKWFTNIKSVGISGATSTPKQQLIDAKEYIRCMILFQKDYLLF